MVELYQNGERSVGRVAKGFDLTETAVREWVKQPERTPRPGRTAAWSAASGKNRRSCCAENVGCLYARRGLNGSCLIPGMTTLPGHTARRGIYIVIKQEPH